MIEQFKVDTTPTGFILVLLNLVKREPKSKSVINVSS